ncbi:unnamed protein product [Calypogeia fissa]
MSRGQFGGRGDYGGPFGARDGGARHGFGNYRGRGRHGYAVRNNPLWADHVEYGHNRQASWDEASHMDSVPSLARPHWEQMVETRELLTKISKIIAENWSEQEHVVCDWDFVEAAYEAKKLKEHAMLCYFTNRAPILQDFREWAEFEMSDQRGWPITQG